MSGQIKRSRRGPLSQLVRKIGTIIRTRSGRYSSIEIHFDGNKTRTPLHKDYVERLFDVAMNKPVGDNFRKGAAKKRTELKTKAMGKAAWTKRDKTSGEFMVVKKSEKKSNGVREEK